MVKEENFGQGELFDEAIMKSECFTRCLRIGCYLLLVASICLFFSPITTLIGYIPLVGGFISGVLFFAILLGALIICIPIFFLALSIAWLRFHPKVGIVLLLIGLVVLGVILFFNFSKGGGAGAGASHLLSLRNGHI